MSQPQENHRRYFRLPYPIGEGPRLAIQGVEYEVSELSEKGLRMYRPDPFLHQPGEFLEGTITFYDGEVAALFGVVGRITEVEVILIKLEGVTFSRMVQEQRNLIRKAIDF